MDLLLIRNSCHNVYVTTVQFDSKRGEDGRAKGDFVFARKDNAES